MILRTLNDFKQVTLTFKKKLGLLGIYVSTYVRAIPKVMIYIHTHLALSIQLRLVTMIQEIDSTALPSYAS